MATVTLPAGKYYLGDPCYTYGQNQEKWSEFCNRIQSNAFYRYDVDGGSVVAGSTMFGDGSYRGFFDRNVDFTFPVDSGLIGLVSSKLASGKSSVYLIESRSEVTFFYDDRRFLFKVSWVNEFGEFCTVTIETEAELKDECDEYFAGDDYEEEYDEDDEEIDF